MIPWTNPKFTKRISNNVTISIHNFTTAPYLYFLNSKSFFAKFI